MKNRTLCITLAAFALLGIVVPVILIAFRGGFQTGTGIGIFITIDSDAFRELNFPFEIVETPGHTADHISLIKEDVMFCGDAAMNNFPSIHRVIIWIENLQQYKQSWKTIIGIHPKMLYPAHGKPFSIDDLNQNLSYLDQICLFPLKKQK